ncbi:hypothetical protein A3J22_02775 [Candidatus Beckwithbacteria bacterium RIFCSPLOWO2_02_FULL_49_12]|nr:MAG: hypothetical protein A3J22_02775 [Candidatus Beckwithbacteria bacterium RIFCSPLOWO2_02_FULL_49_12]HCQ92618.1 hypothetical protein [Candidatus Beckwithbacteria bacterium]
MAARQKVILNAALQERLVNAVRLAVVFQAIDVKVIKASSFLIRFITVYVTRFVLEKPLESAL